MSAVRKVPKVKVGSNIKRKTRKNFINPRRPLYITIIIVLVSFLGSTVSYASLSSLDKQISSQEKEITELKKTRMSLVADVKGIMSSSEIQDEATYTLGMVYPKEDQIVYIDISEEKKNRDVNNNVFLSPIISVLKSFTKE